MTVLAAWVDGASLPDPYDQIGISGHAAVEGIGPSTAFLWQAYVTAGATSEEVNASCIAAATAAAVARSYSVSSVRLVGGSIPEDDDTGQLVVPGTSSTVSLAASTPRQPSATRPVMVMMTGSWSWNLTAIGTQTGSLSFRSDSSSTPTTPIYAPAWSRGIGVGITVADTGTVPVCLNYCVPPAHYYQVVPTGGATFSLREQVM